jgi:hypothetical protein
MRRLYFFILVVVAFKQASAGDPIADGSPTKEQIASWRAEGLPAVDRLIAERAKLIAAAQAVPGKETYTLADEFVVQSDAERAAWKRVQAIGETIDAVAGAKYAHVSGLYWYTDESEALQVAKEQGKAVLALRLLGNLDEELSCANSRYFRILLYPDESIRQLLHDEFVLTWKSVRPVPKITIDLGDGRKVERTITGNSVHYIVLPDGQVVDVLPGLYGPKPFHERLTKGLAAARRAMQSSDASIVLAEYRRTQLKEIEQAWANDIAKYRDLLQKTDEPNSLQKVGVPPTTLPDFWQSIGNLHADYAELGATSKELVKHEALVGLYTEGYGDAAEKRIATEHGDRVIPVLSWVKGGDEAILAMLLSCISPALKADTAYNEYCGRFVALQWLDDNPKEPIEELNRHVYTRIFGYNPDDPWAGLARLDSLTALPKDRGLMEARRSDLQAEVVK